MAGGGSNPKLSTLLQAFGAGVRGRGAEFRSAQETRDKQLRALSAERREALLVDNRMFMQLMRTQGAAAAISFLRDMRAPLIEQLGGDPSDTLEHAALAEQDPAEAMRISQILDQRAELAGDLPAVGAGRKFINVPDVGLVEIPATGAPEVAIATRPKARSEIGRLREDFEAKRISKEELDAGVGQISGLQSVEQIKQLLLIDKLKNDAIEQTDKSQLQLDVLREQIAAGELKKEEAAEKKKKGRQAKSTAARLLKELLADPDAVRSVVGPVDQRFPTVSPRTATAAGKIKQLKSILTAGNLGLMSGVLSETDLGVIADIAGGGLIVTGDDEAFLDELRRMQVSFTGEGVVPEPGAPPRPEATAIALPETPVAPAVPLPAPSPPVAAGGAPAVQRIRFDAQGNRIP